MSKKRLDSVKMKQIAAWKSLHPELSHKELAETFNITEAQARYSLQKYSDFALMQNTKNGRQIISGIIGDFIDEEKVISSQMTVILSELESNAEMAASSRLQMMNNYLTLKNKYQSLKLVKHLKGIDASIVASIIRRYEPNATDEDVIKIFKEELAKVTA